jgi:hypothetical protein
MPATIETLAQNTAAFNAASRGAIVLTTAAYTGDFLQESFFSSLAGAKRRVDRYADQADAPVTDLTEVKRSSVKVAGGFGPVRYEPGQMTWLNRPTAQGIERASAAFADALLADQLNTAIAALVAAIGNQATATNDVSGTGGLTYAAINDAHAKFGDASQNLVAQAMNGAAYHKLIGLNLANAQNLFRAANVLVVDILGKPTIVTDAPALQSAAVTSPSTPAKYKVLSLASNAAVVSDAGNIITNVQTSNGQTRIETTFQADYDFVLGLKGYTWDTDNGGKSPTDAELATGSNWDKVAGDIKNTAGVLTVATTA